MKQERTLLQTKQTNSGLLMTSGNAFWTRTTQCLNTKEDNGQEADFRMQGNTTKDCINVLVYFDCAPGSSARRLSGQLISGSPVIRPVFMTG